MEKCRQCGKEALVMNKDLIYCTICGDSFKLAIEDADKYEELKQ